MVLRIGFRGGLLVVFEFLHLDVYDLVVLFHFVLGLKFLLLDAVGVCGI